MMTLYVFNPHSRAGDTCRGDVVDELSAHGSVTIRELDKDEDIGTFIETLRPKPDRIVVGGGDGTINRMLPFVLSAGVPLGVIPLGTANDFARAIGMPMDPVEAAAAISACDTQRVDVGVINGHHFVNAAGIGLGPELTKHLDKDRKKRLGVLAYLQSLVHAFGNRRDRYAKIEIDGRLEHIKFLQITIANGPSYGGGMTVSEAAKIDDGLLHMLYVKPLSPWQLLFRALRFKTGVTDHDGKIVYSTGQSIKVETARKCDVTADGELTTATPVHCVTRNKALEVLAPTQFSTP